MQKIGHFWRKKIFDLNSHFPCAITGKKSCRIISRCRLCSVYNNCRRCSVRSSTKILYSRYCRRSARIESTSVIVFLKNPAKKNGILLLQTEGACLCQPISWSMAAILRDSVVVAVVIVCTRPRAIPLAMITMRKSIHGFPFLPYMGMGLRYKWKHSLSGQCALWACFFLTCVTDFHGAFVLPTESTLQIER